MKKLLSLLFLFSVTMSVLTAQKTRRDSIMDYSRINYKNAAVNGITRDKQYEFHRINADYSELIEANAAKNTVIAIGSILTSTGNTPYAGKFVRENGGTLITCFIDKSGVRHDINVKRPATVGSSGNILSANDPNSDFLGAFCKEQNKSYITCYVDAYGVRHAVGPDLSLYLTTATAATTYATQAALNSEAATRTSADANLFQNIAEETQYREVALRDSMQKIRDSLTIHANNINYGLSKSDRRADSLKLAVNGKTQPDWNATSGFSRILNKPQITSQWSFLGNSADTTEFLGTTNDVDFVIKRNNESAMQLVANGGVQFNNSVATGTGAVAFGTNNIASGPNSVAMGEGSVASGRHCTAIGEDNISEQKNSVALGYNCHAIGTYSVAIGGGCTASGESSCIAMGNGSVASGSTSVAMGTDCNSSGVASVAMGNGSVASGQSSFAVGMEANSKSFGGVALGCQNDISDVADSNDPLSSDRIFQIGNGFSIKSNAVTVLRNGNFSIGSNYAPTEKLEVSGRIKAQNLRLTDIPIYATDMAATTGGLVEGDVYRTVGGVLMIKL